MPISLATKSDLNEIYKAQPKAFEASVTVPHRLTKEEIQNLSQMALEDGAHYYALKEDNQLIGYTMLGVKEDNLTGDKYGFIYELYVMPTYRKLGYGKQLLAFTKQHFKQLGYDKIRLNVYVGNAAQQLYKSCGFEERNITMQLEL
ncbi:GNAT family N-acetyltransferase [Staphylococcus lloydii]|uniref:GNAT family N-acetyltransferase n=1 Tax=Staphylococcus lloydii TaxID=2781774 RepID=UPI002928C054|nr:GNAT family N-acetyltransferase [Staphylococcus lloydii]MDU9418518.1 GNAT family N-acetyltransferase [Staphylococcus lloydii]